MSKSDKSVSFSSAFYTILDNLMEGCQVIDTDFRYFYINEVAAAHGRLPKESFIGKTMMSIYPGIEDTAMFSVLRESMENRTARRLENEFEFQDGSSRWFDLSFTPVPEGVLVLSVDITNQKETENDLRQREELLGFFIEHAPAALAMFDRDMRYLSTSRRWLKDYNLGERDLTGLSHYEVFPEISERIKAIHRRAMEGEVFRADSDQFDRRDGTVQWLRWEVRPWFKEKDDIGGIVVFSEDISEKKQAEAALARKEERHRIILQTAMDGFWIVSGQGRILEVNDTYCRMSGYSKEELLNMGISDLDACETKLDVADHIKHVRENGQDLFESSHRRKDGSIFHVEISAQHQPVEGVEFVAFIRDISERKRIEKEQQISYEVLRMINESDNWEGLLKSILSKLKEWSQCEAVGIRIRDGVDFPYYVTSGFPEDFIRSENSLCGYDRNGNVKCDPDGRPILECMCGNIINGKYDPSKSFFTTDGSFWSSCTTELLATTTDADRQTRTRNRCNAVGYESVALIPLRSGDVTFGLIQFNDKRKGLFTSEKIAMFRRIANHIANFIAKKQTEENLRKSEEKLRLVTETTNDVIWMRTRGLEKTIYISSAYEKIWERSLESLYQSPSSYMDVVNPDDLNVLKDTIDRFHRNGLPYECEYRIITEGGNTRWIYEKGFPVTEAYNGEMVMTGISSDITERKQAEQEKKQIEKQFIQSQKLETVGRLAGGVAHDFNNLLMVQMGYCELTEGKLKEGDPLLKNVREIKECANRGANLTQQLLAFSRKQKLNPRVLDLNKVVKNIENMLSRLIGEDIDLSLALKDNLWRVKADPGQIEQVIMNLAVNARDAMPDGGRLTIETSNTVLDENYSPGHTGVVPGPYVLLAISDTGCGMDDETKKKLFEPFFTTKSKGKGSGLGLATVYGIVKQSGGNIWAYSEPGAGATIKIYLPRVDAELSEYIQKELEIVSGHGELILLVEDEPALRELFAQMIQELGYQVKSAANGGEALMMVEDEALRTDLLLTDVVMPGMSGRVLAERLQKIQPGMKALYMSGYTDETIVQHGVISPHVQYIQKPFGKLMLSNKIREVLAR